MIKAIFILENLTREKIDKAIELNANAIFAPVRHLTQESALYIRQNRLRLFVEVGIFQGEELWKKYPDSRPVDRNGKPMSKIGWYAGACPNNPEVKREKLTLIKKLIRNYKVDGVWLDFIRYPCHWEEVRTTKIEEYCFCANCVGKFDSEVGGKPEGKKWIEWKCQRIANFVASVKRLTKKTTLGVFAVPWQKKEFDGAIKKIIGQDFELLSRSIDVFSPMLYHKFCDRPLSWIEKGVDYFSRETKTPILPIVQTEDRAGKIGPKEFGEEIKSAMKNRSDGVIVFYLEDLLKDEKKVGVLSQLFNR